MADTATQTTPDSVDNMNQIESLETPSILASAGAFASDNPITTAIVGILAVVGVVTLGSKAAKAVGKTKDAAPAVQTRQDETPAETAARVEREKAEIPTETVVGEPDDTVGGAQTS
jgi:hypothetical protein